MQPEKRDPAYLWDMLVASRQVIAMTQGKAFEDYLANFAVRLAVERALEIIGEAARHVSVDFRAAHPEIPWQGIIGQRNVIAHDYGDLKHELVWDAAINRMPELVSALQPLVSDQ